MIHVCFIVLENPKKMKLVCLLQIKISLRIRKGKVIFSNKIKKECYILLTNCSVNHLEDSYDQE